MKRLAIAIVALLVAAPSYDVFGQEEEGGGRRRRGGQEGGEGRGGRGGRGGQEGGGGQERGGRGGQDRGGRGTRGGFGRGGFGGRSTGKASLLTNAQVLAELKVKDEQGDKIADVLSKFRDASRELFSGLRDIPREEREEKMAELSKKREALTKKTDGALAKILSKEQNKRLDQIVLQQKGLRALGDDAAVIAALKVSEEQQKKIKGAYEEERAKRTKLFEEARGGGREGFAKIREAMEKLSADTEKAVLAALTKEQLKKFEELKGKKFVLERRGGRTRGGQRGGAGGREGGGREGGGRGGREGGGEGGTRRRRPQPDEI